MNQNCIFPMLGIIAMFFEMAEKLLTRSTDKILAVPSHQVLDLLKFEIPDERFKSTV